MINVAIFNILMTAICLRLFLQEPGCSYDKLFSWNDWLTNALTKLTFTCSKSTIETLQKGLKYAQIRQLKHQNDVIEVGRRSCVFIVKFEHVSHLFLLFLLLTLNKQMLAVKRFISVGAVAGSSHHCKPRTRSFFCKKHFIKKWALKTQKP